MHYRIPSDGKDNRIDILKRDGLMFTVESVFFSWNCKSYVEKIKTKASLMLLKKRFKNIWKIFWALIYRMKYSIQALVRVSSIASIRWGLKVYVEEQRCDLKTLNHSQNIWD